MKTRFFTESKNLLLLIKENIVLINVFFSDKKQTVLLFITYINISYKNLVKVYLTTKNTPKMFTVLGSGAQNTIQLSSRTPLMPFNVLRKTYNIKRFKVKSNAVILNLNIV